MALTKALRTSLQGAAMALVLALPEAAAAQQPPPPSPNPERLAKVEAAKGAPTGPKSTASGGQSPQQKEAAGVLPAPRPGALELERAHIARFDAAIAAVHAYPLSSEDASQLSSAINRIAANDLNEANQHRAAIKDATAQKIVDWYRLRSGFGEPQEYRAFLAANAAWPDRTLLVQRMEEALFTQGGGARFIREFFKDAAPATGIGYAALASAHLAEGDKATATRLARTAWRDFEIPSTLETGFLERFGTLLTEADHRWRLDRLLLDDPRWSANRSQSAAIARRLIPLLSKPEQQKAQARLAVFLLSGNAQTLMKALPASSDTDWGLTFHQIQLLRRSNRIAEASKLLLTVPNDPKLIVAPDAWWIERRTNAYASLRTGQPKTAYELVKDAGPLGDNPSKDQAFTAGWLALRYLKNAKAAETHFTFLAKSADGPLSRSKGEYWLGRAYEAQGRKADAEKHYRAAAEIYDTFHGQLARRKLGADAQRIEIKLPNPPTPDQIERFNANDAVRAAVIARKAGLNRTVTRSFLSQLNRVYKTEAEVAMVAHLAEALGDTQMAVRIGKSAIGRGLNLISYAYPVHPFPSYSPLREPPEAALLLGIARQESEFNPQIVSGAGARGILQVMPITARHVCRDYKIKCDISRLLTDPSYNAMLASAYIADRMGEFQGSYVLGIAGYNAGPGRARQWIREFGDPRDPKVDPEDWIHRIPFEETRDYVQKVLSNLQIYRARLGQGPSKLRIAEDLVRARHTGDSGGGSGSDTDGTPKSTRN